MAEPARRCHLLADFRLAESGCLDDVAFWERTLRSAAAAGGATVLHAHFHRFEPQGLTGFLLLAESHLSVHTWPEEALAAVDLFACGSMDVERVLGVLREALAPAGECLHRLDRGTG